MAITAREAAARSATIRTGAEYIDSLRGRKLKVYLFGELVDEPVDHPMIRPSINAVAETYDLAVRNPELGDGDCRPTRASAVNRFLHIAQSAEDLVSQNKMQRRLGQLHRHLLPALRRHGRVERAALGHLRDRRAARHRLSRALQRIRTPLQQRGNWSSAAR